VLQRKDHPSNAERSSSPAIIACLYSQPSSSVVINIIVFHMIFQEGEPVEYTTTTDDRGKTKTERVTGPQGAFGTLE